jgi:hypothetical protein
MKKHIIVLTGALGLGAIIAIAQDAGSGPGPRPGGGPGGPGFGGPRRQPAIIAALDANKDGKLDAKEIANASVALKTLDKNGDGEITMEEMFGPRPDGPRRGPGGPGGPGGERPQPPEQ